MSEDWLERLHAAKRRYPLPDVMEARGVTLRRGGPGTFWAHCPFHADRRPSLLVDLRRADDPHWHCVGCHKYGDVVDFVRLRDNLATVSAALARLTGSPPPQPARSRPATASSPAVCERRWDHLTLEEQLVLNTTVTLYQHALWRHPPALAYLRQHALWRHPPALAYLRQRGFSDSLIRRCGLGYADGHSLEAYLRQHGGLRLAETLGLLRRPEQGEGGRPLRERFGGRIVVPEIRGGQPIWLIGRRPDELGQVKYLSLPGERPILGLEQVVGRREVFLAEGVFDWLTAIGWGLPAFSSCGTALPPHQLGWLARARVVWGLLDADTAGRQAAARFGAALGQRWQPLGLPEGCDLNDLGRRSDGRAAFFGLLDSARGERWSTTSKAGAMAKERTNGNVPAGS
jgi:DNA primase